MRRVSFNFSKCASILSSALATCTACTPSNISPMKPVTLPAADRVASRYCWTLTLARLATATTITSGRNAKAVTRKLMRAMVNRATAPKRPVASRKSAHTVKLPTSSASSRKRLIASPVEPGNERAPGMLRICSNRFLRIVAAVLNVHRKKTYMSVNIRPLRNRATASITAAQAFGPQASGAEPVNESKKNRMISPVAWKIPTKTRIRITVVNEYSPGKQRIKPNQVWATERGGRSTVCVISPTPLRRSATGDGSGSLDPMPAHFAYPAPGSDRSPGSEFCRPAVPWKVGVRSECPSGC